MADKIYKLIFSMDDDTEQEIHFTVPQGDAGVGITDIFFVDHDLHIATSDGNVRVFPEIKGADGAAGVGIVDITSTNDTTDGAINTMQIKTSDNVIRTFYIKNGSTGAKGDNGKDGKSSYQYAQEGGYTGTEAEFAQDINPDNINANFIEFISTELAKRGQLKPEFANDISECTDTTKLYVLPDGYIYAYMLAEKVVGGYTNQIPISTDVDTDSNVENDAVYNVKGYKENVRLSTNGTDSVSAGSYVTGFIPCKKGDVIRFQNFGFSATTVNGLTPSTQRLCVYDATKTMILVTSASAIITDSIMSNETGSDGNLTQLVMEHNATDLTAAAFFRINGHYIGADTIITVNEEIKEPENITDYAWTNTGHAFVPADYEDRILDLEDRATSLENRVDELVAGTDSTFTYVTEEAKRVAGIVQENRTVGSLTFTAMSDCHVEVDTTNEYGLKNNLTSCRDAGLGLSELQKYLKLDFTAMLGDYTWGDKAETVAQVKKDLTYVKRCMADGMRSIPNIWCTGNHDINYGKDSDRRMTEDELYAYLISNNKGTTQDGDNIGRNYGYIDFENQKIRCIYLNTIDVLDYPDNTDGTEDRASGITATQAQWLVDVGLNLSNKTDATEWSIVFLSHHGICQFQHITTILTAYKDGTSGTVNVTTNEVTTTVYYDFTSVTRGEIICAIHGHDHNFTYRKISNEPWSQVTEANAWLWSICVPNMDTMRNNEKATDSNVEYAAAFGEFDAEGNPVYYPKTQGTGTSTSFCVITIDRKNRKIHAIAYGAGRDREISY